MSPLAWPLILLVRAYQLMIRPVIGTNCRFEPHCSAYAIEALREHGAVRGSGLAAWRVLRCNPWNEGGYDPVPPCDCRRGHAAPHGERP
jgi:putative membrane protein insertion efficiency factor